MRLLGAMGLALVLVLAGGAASARADVLVKDGETVAFLGDSITAGGMGPKGYVRLVESGLKVAGVNIKVIGAGVGGHKSNDMLKREDKDVISKNPQWMTISCGVNDVWHGSNGVPLDKYKTNMTEIVDKAQKAGIKVMILTATMIGEDQPNANNQKLVAYNDFLRELAKEKKCPLADLNADMQAGVAELKKTTPKGNVMTADGVHMNGAGNKMMATGILRAFGLDEAQMAKVKSSWEESAGTKPAATNEGKK